MGFEPQWTVGRLRPLFSAVLRVRTIVAAMPFCSFCSICAAVFWAASLAVPAICSAAPNASWLTGAQLVQKLAEPATFSWTNAPAQRVLANLSDTQHVAILLDRRIDPQQHVTLATTNEPLGDVLGELANRLSGGYCQFGPLAYIGPVETAEKLRTLAALRLEDVKRLDKERVRELLRLRAWNWDDLAEPRQLMEDLARQADVELIDEGRIPHDLWRGADLPPLSWIDRVTLLAAQFDLTFRLEGGGHRVRFTPLPAHLAIVRTYAVGGNAQALAARWARQLPEARVTAAGSEIRVEGRLEDHELAARRFQSTPQRRTTVTPGEQRFQFAVENAALDAVVAQLAERLDLDVQWDSDAIEAAGVATDQLITVRVKDATLDDLLRAIFQDTSLSFERTDKAVAIRPSARRRRRSTRSARWHDARCAANQLTPAAFPSLHAPFARSCL